MSKSDASLKENLARIKEIEEELRKMKERVAHREKYIKNRKQYRGKQQIAAVPSASTSSHVSGLTNVSDLTSPSVSARSSSHVSDLTLSSNYEDVLNDIKKQVEETDPTKQNKSLKYTVYFEDSIFDLRLTSNYDRTKYTFDILNTTKEEEDDDATYDETEICLTFTYTPSEKKLYVDKYNVDDELFEQCLKFYHMVGLKLNTHKPHAKDARRKRPLKDCQEGYLRNPKTQRCKKKRVYVPCRTGLVRHKTTKQCVKKKLNESACKDGEILNKARTKCIVIRTKKNPTYVPCREGQTRNNKNRCVNN